MSKRTRCTSYNLNNYKIIRNRELGLKQDLGYTEDVSRKIYTNIDAYQSDIPMQKYTADQGGIFNLEFSQDGRLLVAACEERSVLLFDASNQKHIKKISDAHCSCVNCVRFLDAHTFATCSDDNTVKLWDTRRLKSALRTLQGHANWVKNIEYIEKDQIMVTSAFDGSVYAWDLKSPTENNVLYNNVFVMNGLMRTKLTPDGSKMIICTTSGYIIIIHELNLATLSNDLKSFRKPPNVRTNPSIDVINYQQLQTLPAEYVRIPATFTNKIVKMDQKQLICLLSKIQKLLTTQYHECRLGPNLYRLMQLSEQTFPSATIFNHLFHQDRKTNRLEFIDDFPNEAEVISSLQIHPMGWCALSRSINSNEVEEWTTVHDIQTREPSDYKDAYRFVEEPAVPEDDELEDSVNRRPTDIWMGFITNEHLSAYRSQHGPNAPDNIHTTMGIINSGIIGHDAFRRQFRNNPEDRNRIIMNLPRLTHYKKEKSVGKGYIKELCFSSDGRIICSPYNRGIRLLGFNQHVQELCYCVPKHPKELFTIAEMNDYHSDVVVSCKFNPRHYQMVSGCLGGDIVWYKPIL